MVGDTTSDFTGHRSRKTGRRFPAQHQNWIHLPRHYLGTRCKSGADVQLWGTFVQRPDTFGHCESGKAVWMVPSQKTGPARLPTSSRFGTRLRLRHALGFSDR